MIPQFESGCRLVTHPEKNKPDTTAALGVFTCPARSTLTLETRSVQVESALGAGHYVSVSNPRVPGVQMSNIKTRVGGRSIVGIA